MVRDDQLSLMQELIGDAYAFVEQAARILPKIENQSFDFALLGKGIERVLYLFFRGLVETRDVHVSDAGANQEVEIHAVTRNLVANDAEFERLFGAFAKNGDVYSGPFGTLQQVGNIAGGHVVGGLAIDGYDDV